MKRFFLLITSLLAIHSANAQTTAMDWTKDDCGTSTSHNLFAELESGFVIVQEYVMMNCSPCVTGGNGLKNLVAPFETSHPGKVRIYQTAYNNTTTCAQMNTWASTNNFTGATQFRQGSTEVNYYGGMGMPTIVVMGGADHTVFYADQGYSPSSNAAITAAITDAIAASPVINDINSPEPALSLYLAPNPTQTQLTVNSPVVLNHIEILDLSGKTMLSVNDIAQTSITLNTAILPKGLYVVKATDLQGNVGISKLAKQ